MSVFWRKEQVMGCTCTIQGGGASARLIAIPVLRPHQIGPIALPWGRKCCAIIIVVLGPTRRCICVLRGKCMD